MPLVWPTSVLHPVPSVLTTPTQPDWRAGTTRAPRQSGQISGARRRVWVVARPGARAGRSLPSGPLEVGQAFGTRYHIIRLLGVGGMGAVYQAWDAELGVAVAIKVIRPEMLAADPQAAARNRAPLQARAAARAAGHPQERRPHSRSRRDRRHQVHHDAVRRGRRSRDDPEDGRQAARCLARSGSREESCPAWSPRTRPASSTAI